jgi:hypothetical protein
MRKRGSSESSNGHGWCSFSGQKPSLSLPILGSICAPDAVNRSESWSPSDDDSTEITNYTAHSDAPSKHSLACMPQTDCIAYKIQISVNYFLQHAHLYYRNLPGTHQWPPHLIRKAILGSPAKRALEVFKSFDPKLVKSGH